MRDYLKIGIALYGVLETCNPVVEANKPVLHTLEPVAEVTEFRLHVTDLCPHLTKLRSQTVEIRLDASKAYRGFLELYKKVPNLCKGRGVCFVCHASGITGFAMPSRSDLWRQRLPG